MLSPRLAKKEMELKEVLNSEINAAMDKYSEGMAKLHLADKRDMAIAYDSLIGAGIVVQDHLPGYDEDGNWDKNDWEQDIKDATVPEKKQLRRQFCGRSRDRQDDDEMITPHFPVLLQAEEAATKLQTHGLLNSIGFGGQVLHDVKIVGPKMARYVNYLKPRFFHPEPVDTAAAVVPKVESRPQAKFDFSGAEPRKGTAGLAPFALCAERNSLRRSGNYYGGFHS